MSALPSAGACATVVRAPVRRATLTQLAPVGLAAAGAASGLVWTAAFIAIGFAFSESFADAGETATRVGLVAVLLVTALSVAIGRLRRAR